MLFYLITTKVHYNIFIQPILFWKHHILNAKISKSFYLKKVSILIIDEPEYIIQL